MAFLFSQLSNKKKLISENGNVHHNGKRPKPEPGTEISSLTVSPNTMDELKEELYFLSDPSLQLNKSVF